MNILKKPTFYVDKHDTYGDIVVKPFKDDLKGKRAFKTEVLNEGRSIMYISALNNHIVMRSESMKDEEIQILNDALVQLEMFRGLMFVKRNGKWCLIVEGQSVDFSIALEIFYANNTYYVAIPYRDIREKVPLWV